MVWSSLMGIAMMCMAEGHCAIQEIDEETWQVTVSQYITKERGYKPYWLYDRTESPHHIQSMNEEVIDPLTGFRLLLTMQQLRGT